MNLIDLGTLGSAASALALALALYAMIAGAIGAVRRDARLQTSARLTAVAVFLATSIAIVAMVAALLTDDFSVKYVAEHSRIASPTWVKVVTLWAALEGSILLWAWLLTAYTAVLATTTPNTVLRPWALAIMQFVSVFFLLVVVVVANPFVVLANPPLDGPGANPLLQNHWMMAVHPMLMYLGFVGLTIPFAFAMAALITRRPGTEWMAQTRRWTLAGWGFLTAAIVAGGWWSYEVLGWGGYWAWDPVENVSFMPWLTATAFLHSVQVQERRRMLKSWNVLLIVLTFALSILGTFLTRSGVVSSVHAFGDGPVGPVFLGFFFVITLGSLGLVAWRWDQVRDRAELDAAVSREGAFLGVNVLFLAMTFAVLLGTLFPLIVEAINGSRVTVGAPFFDQISLPLWMLVLWLMGVGPLLPWRRAEGQSLRRNLAAMSVGFAVAAVAAFTFGMRGIYPLLTVGLAGWNVVSIGLLLAGAVVPRARLARRGLAATTLRYANEQRRKVGSMVVHLGVVVMALGILASSAYRTDVQLRLPYGERVAFASYELEALRPFAEQDLGRTSVGVEVGVIQDGRQLEVLRPRINVFAQNSMAVATPAVHYTAAHDLYLSVAGAVDPNADAVIMRVVQSPGIIWVWIAGAIMALGTVWALTPMASRRKALAEAPLGERSPA
ncbi:MAG: heme lyase CcmF/NrfE family subunit [Trueperaceae bacterium]|nr:heme lyase CcmF/NrfE family subunit [Trueperaceae bacterium]